MLTSDGALHFFRQLIDACSFIHAVLVTSAVLPRQFLFEYLHPSCAEMQVPLPGVDARVEILRKSLMKLRVELNQVTMGCKGSLVPSWWFDATHKSSVAEDAEGLPESSAIASNSRLRLVCTLHCALGTAVPALVHCQHTDSLHMDRVDYSVRKSFRLACRHGSISFAGASELVLESRNAPAAAYRAANTAVQWQRSRGNLQAGCAPLRARAL